MGEAADAAELPCCSRTFSTWLTSIDAGQWLTLIDARLVDRFYTRLATASLTCIFTAWRNYRRPFEPPFRMIIPTPECEITMGLMAKHVLLDITTCFISWNYYTMVQNRRRAAEIDYINRWGSLSEDEDEPIPLGFSLVTHQVL